jgi:hypothetical protein
VGKLSMTVRQVVAFMHGNSVAAACTDLSFTSFVRESLVVELGMTNKQLTAFMCTGVAANYKKAAFISFLNDFLKGELCMTTQHLAKFMSNSVAKSSLNPAFIDFIRDFLMGKLGMKTDQLARCMAESLASGFSDSGLKSAMKQVLEQTNLDTLVFLFSKNGFASCWANVYADVLETIKHIRATVSSLKNEPLEVARLFGMGPLFKVAACIRFELMAISSSGELHTRFKGMRAISSGRKYGQQTALARAFLSNRALRT